MAEVWIVVGNIAAHDGHVDSYRPEDLWSNENPGGVTFQELEGNFGQILDEFDNPEDARDYLDEWLECDNEYCYTHGDI